VCFPHSSQEQHFFMHLAPRTFHLPPALDSTHAIHLHTCTLRMRTPRQHPVQYPRAPPIADSSMSAINTTAADEACAFNFSDNQGRHYHKTEFILYWREVEVVSDLLGRIFYDEDNETWSSMTPAQLREIALANVLREDIIKNNSVSWESPIYGSAIAFEPDVWTQTDGLAEGVTFPASSVACRENASYCESPTESSDLVLTELNTNNDGMTLYSPYAFRGPSDMSIYQQCSEDKPEFCPSMDLAFAYDYSNITTKTAEWYNVSIISLLWRQLTFHQHSLIAMCEM
jgi:hypothetical protein